MQLNYKIIFLLFLVTSQAEALDSLRTEQINGDWMVIHQVQKGETLYSLSKRYGSDIGEIVKQNQIVDNTLALDQLLQIPVKKPLNAQRTTESTEEKDIIHVVTTGETLFSISRQYGLKVYELREMNDLKGNEIAIGQELRITRTGSLEIPDEPKDEPKMEEPIRKTGDSDKRMIEGPASTYGPPKPDENFIEYQVQTGDELESIARTHGVRVDSLIYWNGLNGDYLAIGQKLKLKNKPEFAQAEVKLTNTPYGTRKKIIDQSGFVRVIEEGLAMKIEEVIETNKYLCLHRSLPVGSLVEIRNLMNNQKVFVKVVGKLPDTGLNEQVLIRLTPVAFKRLGIIDPRARVEISYFEE